MTKSLTRTSDPEKNSGAKDSSPQGVAPLVSFVVPCYNLAHYLPECVNSILAQTYQNYEVLIMDNCSPDNTSEVARAFLDSRVKYIRNSTNIGHVRNFNRGVEMASGKYVWLLSADDALRSHHVLERYVQLMEQHPGVGFVFCNAVEVCNGQDVGNRESGVQDTIWPGKEFLAELVQCNVIAQSSGMIRKACLGADRPPFQVEMPFACDWYFWCGLALKYDVAYFADAMVSCRVHEESLTSLFNQEDPAVCIKDELNVLWQVARLAELAGMKSLRTVCNNSIGILAGRAMMPKDQRYPMPILSKDAFDTLLSRHAKGSSDRNEIWAYVHVTQADAHYSSGEDKEAVQSYWRSLQLRPWWVKTWAKYLLSRTGTTGKRLRKRLVKTA